MLCRRKHGNKGSFTCPFHGWTFSNTGKLLKVKDEKTTQYPEQFNKNGSHDLTRVAKFENYRGFLFGSLNPDSPSLEEYLGEARVIIDQIVDQAPDGLEVLRGNSSYIYDGNWKLQMENGCDGYHVSSVHWNYQATMGRRKEEGTKAVDASGWSKSVAGVYGFENGHILLWTNTMNPEVRPVWAHRDEIAAELDTFLSDTQHWLAWDALLDLVPRMAFDLGPEFLHVYQRLLTAVLRASCTMHKNLTHGDDALAARIVERAFHSAAWIFRAVSSLMGTDAPDILLTSWSIVRGVLIDKQTTSHAWRFATEALSHLIRKAPISHLHALQARMIADADDASAEGIAATWANSCQSASHTLHSRTREMLSCVLVLDAQPVELVRHLG